MSLIDSPESRLGGLSAEAFSSMFQAIGGLRNRRALLALLGCLVLGIVIGALLSTMGGILAGALAALLYVVAVGTGINAAGLLQMDQARGVPLRSTTDALVAGLLCIPKLIVLGLAFALAAIALFIAIALVFVVCKIPFLGPILYVVVFPLSVLAAGLTITGLVVCVVLSLPAIWEGSTITRALAQTFAIARSRLIEALLLLAFVGLLCFAVGMIAFGVIGTGLLPTVGMSASILGMGGMVGLGEGMASLAGIVQGFDGGYAIAGLIGFGVLWAIAIALVGQVSLQGLSLVYLRVTEGLDIAAAEATLQNALKEARQRGGDLASKVRGAAARDAAIAPGGSDAPGASTSATSATSLSSAPSPAVSDDTLPTHAASALRFDNDPPGAPAGPTEHMLASALRSTPAAPAPAPPAASTPSPAAVHVTCPQCLAACAPDDVCCGVCGHRFK